MPRGWRVLDCSSMCGQISSVRGAISIEPEGKPAVSVPISDVAVLLVGHRVVFSGGALHRCLSAGVAVMLCDWRGVPEGAAFGWSDHSRVAARRRAQAVLSEPRRKNAWKQVVRQKIAGQAACLDYAGRPGGDFLRELRKQVRSGDPTNIEGQAAKFYWKSLFGVDFLRSPGAHQGVNGMLDYAYAVVRGHGIRAVLSAGLEPALGIFHHGRSNPFCLVDDLMEVFRPAVDYVVFDLARNGVPDFDSIKSQLVAGASAQFSEGGLTIPAVFEDFAQVFGRYIEDDIDKLVTPIWSMRNGG